MSRFIDAMRERGRQAGKDGGVREYKGKIVDAEAVLGSRVDHSAQPSAELSIEPLAAAAEAVPPTSATEPTATPVEVHANNTTESENEFRNRQRTSPTHAASDGVPAVQHAPAYSPPNQGLPGISMQRLDPLFYLIVGIAIVGLFTCLYALITQSDVYFEREYQQLQQESAALQARIEASRQLEIELKAASTPRAEGSILADQQSPAPDKELEITANEIDQNSQSAIKAPEAPEAPEVQVVPGLAITEATINDPEPVQRAVIIEAPDDTALALLREQVESLRTVVDNQESVISRLQRENREFASILDRPQVEPQAQAKVEQPITRTQQVAKEVLSIEATTPADKASVFPSVISSVPVLQTPRESEDREITDLVQRGYLAYQARDLTAASDFYGKALEFDPYNRDANLGVAAAAQAGGDFRLAEDRYRHLLTLDPVDEVAFSALLNLAVKQGQSAGIEYELVQHANYVDDPQHLYAILGNYYSQQGLWLKAESVYEVAVNGSRRTADTLFNYAVALDNIGRTRQAASYYDQALRLTENQAHSFDVDAARLRYQSLLADNQ